jgi:hypothetical protein
MLARPVPTNTTRAIAALATPMTPHNSQTGKNAPNRSKEGAPLVEHPTRLDATKRMTNRSGGPAPILTPDNRCLITDFDSIPANGVKF